ncbi:MAG: hypothetical protein IKS11_05975 [Lachnospiraceae bacterium]|nr:hypothetical protein [Lachnospiraceae bacterium]
MNILFNTDREELKKITTLKEYTDFLLEKEREKERMSETERAAMDDRIMAKLAAGKKLSQKELDYLRRTNPILYAHAMRIQRIAMAVEEQLKHAKSKEEADRIISCALGGISKNDPDREYIFAAVNRIVAEFHKSGAYNKLPGTAKDGKEKSGRANGEFCTDAEDAEDVDLDLINWSPLKEVYDNMPAFSTGA